MKKSGDFFIPTFLVSHATRSGLATALNHIIDLNVDDFCVLVANAVFLHLLNHAAAVDSCPSLGQVAEGKVDLDGMTIDGEKSGCGVSLELEHDDYLLFITRFFPSF
jgi:hypothetical protein